MNIDGFASTRGTPSIFFEGHPAPPAAKIHPTMEGTLEGQFFLFNDGGDTRHSPLPPALGVKENPGRNGDQNKSNEGQNCRKSRMVEHPLSLPNASLSAVGIHDNAENFFGRYAGRGLLSVSKSGVSWTYYQ